jgi:hypothetical protein
LEVKQTGEYRIETLGEGDPRCQLWDIWQGKLASDNDSGVNKNCRFDLRLVKGSYLLKIKRRKLPLRVRLMPYRLQGSVGTLKLWQHKDSTLKVGHRRRFLFALKKMRNVQLFATGSTLHHCRLLRYGDWPVPSQVLHFPLAGSRGENSCALKARLLPGVYVAELYGQKPQLASSNTREGAVSLSLQDLSSRPALASGASFLRPASSRGMTYTSLRIKRSGTYWISGGPHARSCALFNYGARRATHLPVFLRTLQPGVKKYRSLPLKITRRGAVHWVLLKESAMLTLTTRGSLDTFCSIRRVDGRFRFRNDDSGPGTNCRIQRNLPGGLYKIIVRPLRSRRRRRRTRIGNRVYSHIYEVVRKTTMLLRIDPHQDNVTGKRLRTLLDDAMQTVGFEPDKEGCAGKVYLKRGRYTLQTGRNGAPQLLLQQLLPLPIGRNGSLTLAVGGRSARFPMMQKGGRLAVSVKGATSCKLMREGEVLLKGKTRGNTCLLEGTVVRGEGQLEIAGVNSRSRRVTISLQQGRAIKKTPRHLRFALPRWNILRFGQKKVVRLNKHGETIVAFQLKRAQTVRLETEGLLNLACALHTQGQASLFRKVNGGSGKNCRLTQYLPAGVYLFSMFARGGTAGQAILSLNKAKRGATVRSTGTGILFRSVRVKANQEVVARFQPSGGSTLVEVQALHGKVTCRLERDGVDWPVYVGQRCRFVKALPKGSYTLRVLPYKATRRLRFIVGSDKGFKSFFPPTSRYYKRKDPSTIVPLMAHETLRTNLSPTGLDRFSIMVSSNSLVQFSLPKGFVGQLSLKKKVVHTLKGSVPKTLKVRLTDGFYLLDITDSKGRSTPYYKLGYKWLEFTRSRMIYDVLPLAVKLRVEQPGFYNIRITSGTDTYCQLTRLNGELVARNDDFNAQTWDCGLFLRLKRGVYRLKIGGERGRGLLMVSTRPARQFSKATLGTGDGGGGSVSSRSLSAGYTGRFSFTATKWLRLSVKLRRGKSAPLKLEWTRKSSKPTICQSQLCKSVMLLPPGKHHLLVSNISSVAQTISSMYHWKPLLQWSVGTPLHVVKQSRWTGLLKLAQSKRLQLTLTPKARIALRCTLQARDGKVLRSAFPCHQPFLAPAGTSLLTVRSSKQIKFGTLSLISTPVVLMNTNGVALVLPGKEVHLPLNVATAGFYEVAVMSNEFPGASAIRRWNCQLQNQRVSIRENRWGCRFIVQLSEGRKVLWLSVRSRKSTNRARLFWKRLSLNTTLPSKPWQGRAEGSLVAGQQKRWAWAKNAWVTGTVLLQGRGRLLLMSQSGEVLRICESHGKLRSCRWKVTALPASALHLQATGTVKYRARLVNVQKAVRVSSLRWNQNMEWIGRGLRESRAFVFGRVPRRGGRLVAQGRGLRCRLWLTPIRFVPGCRHKLVPGQRVSRFEVSGVSGTIRVMAFTPGRRARAVWSYRLRTGTARRLFLKAGRRSGFNGRNHRFEFSVQQPTAVRFVVSTGAAVCALQTHKKERTFAAHTGQRGCVLERVLKAGSYRFLVRGFAFRKLMGTVLLERQGVVVLKAGRQSGYLLASGDTRWFGFNAVRDGKLGIGVLTHHERLHCRLVNAHGHVVSRQCQSYPTLKKGQHWLQVRLSAKAPASVLEVVLRGLKKPSHLPPTKVLKTWLRSRQ